MTDPNLILRVAARGEGVTADGRYVPLAAPGDRLADGGTVIPGPNHVVPPCRHFPVCGGCTLQHIDDAAYGQFLADRIVGALASQGLPAPDMAPAHISPPRSRRRASLRAERKGAKLLIGFNEGSSHRIVDMAECHILDPRLFALVAPLRSLLRPMVGDRRSAGIRMTVADQGIDLLLDKVEADSLATTEALTEFAQKHHLARLVVDDGYGPQTRWEPEPVTITLGGVPVPLPADTFLQATPDGEAALVAAMRDAVGDAPIIADLFAGLGTFALSLPPGRRIYAAEASRDAVLALKAATQRIAVDHRDLYRRPLTTAELDRFDAIILDPPRAGAADQITQLAASKAPRIAYISCNPSSFARDTKILVESGYRLDRITPVGQFRWSTHVELCAAFRR